MRVVIVVAALLREALLVAKLLLAASLAFDRSLAPNTPLARRVRVSSADYPLANIISIHSAGIHTAGPLGILPNTQRSARDLLLATITHTRLRGRSADRIAEVEAEALEGGKNVYSVYAIRFTTPTARRSETIHVLRVAIASDSATPAVTLNLPLSFPRRRAKEDGLEDDDDRQDSPR